MSTLTQARLAPLSQRYLFNKRTYDPSERCQLRRVNESSQQLQRQWLKPVASKHGLKIGEKTNTPGLLYLLTNQLSSTTIESVKKFFSDSKQIKDYNNDSGSYSDLKGSIRKRCESYYPLSAVHLIKYYGFNNDYSHDGPLAINLETPKFSHKYHYLNYHDADRSKFSENPDSKHVNPTLIALLAVLGLFDNKKSGDIEEERSKLSDAKKLEKMRPLERKIAIGVLWMCEQEYGRANQLFHEALQIAQEEKDEEQENVVLNLIASNYFESGDWDHAEKLFIDLIKRMIASEMAPTDPAILELSLKLASIYSKNQATQHKALKGFKFVINSLLYDLDDILRNIDELDVSTLSEHKRNSLALLGWSYDWFAKHLLSINDYNGAANMLQRALQISSKVLGQSHDQTLILLNDIGTTLAMNNSPEEGRAFIKKAVEGAIETQSKELPSFYVNLGLVNMKLGKLEAARRYCEYSIELVGKNQEHHNSHEVIELSKSCFDEIKRLLRESGQ